MGVGSFSLPINAPTDQYQNPSDWVSITGVPDNEIYLVTSDIEFASVAFTVTTSTGTYNVDWGDGTQTTGITSNTIAQKQYTYGSGLTGTTLPGVTTFRCRIWATSGTITRFFISRNTTIASFQSQSILSANFGTTGLTSMANAFFAGTTTTVAYNLKSVFLPATLNSCTTMANAFQNCTSLERCDMPVSMTGCTTFASTFQACNNLPYLKLPTNLGSSFTIASMFESCRGLYRVDYPTTMNGCTSMNRTHVINTALNQVNLPQSLTGCTNMNQAFEECRSLSNIDMPTNMNANVSFQRAFLGCTSLVTFELPSSNTGSNYEDMFSGCTALQSFIMNATTMSGTLNRTFVGCRSLVYVKFPATYTTSNTNANDCFNGCISLEEITLPSTPDDSLNFTSRFFANCSSLRVINNLNNFGNNDAGNAMSGDSFITNNENLTGITLNQRWSVLNIIGTSTIPTKITAIRLNNNFATQWGGASPQINVSWNSLGQAALVDLFNDLITVTAKTINITGNPGAALLTPAERAIATGKGWTITG